VAIGNPFGLESTVTTGIVSALQREIQSTTEYAISDVIQTDAAINPGNSGGPLINERGEVIGVNSQIATGGSGNGSVGIGFAVPSNTVTEVVGQLKESGEVEHAFLGISGIGLEPGLIEQLDLEVEGGVLIQEVTPGGPADEAGLSAGDEPVSIQGAQVLTGGDIIVAVDGDRNPSMEDVISRVNDAEVGDTLELEVSRGGETRTVEVTLADRPDDGQAADSPDQDTQPQMPPGFGQ
jgi:S1-C subfamily serine protease